MIQNFTYLPGLQHIELSWNRPAYDSIMYVLYYSCHSHDGIHHYVDYKVAIENSSSTSATVSGLLLESICIVTLFAVYNPASVDRGLTIKTETLRIERAKGKS